MMQASIGVESPVTMKFWNEQERVAKWGIESQLRYKAKSEGWEIDGGITYTEAFFMKWEDDGDFTATANREEAHLVMIHATAKAKKIHPASCTYPETQHWCAEHIEEFWEGKL